MYFRVSNAEAAVAHKRAEISRLLAQAENASGEQAEQAAKAIKADNEQLSSLIEKLEAARLAVRAEEANPPTKRQVPWDDDAEIGGQRYGSILALKNTERIADHVGSSDRSANLSLATWLKGIVTGDWDGVSDGVKAMSIGTPSAGGFVVPTPLSARLIDLARNAARVFQAGATTVVMESSTLRVPRLLTDAVGEWKPENAELGSESDLAFDAVTLTAKSLMAIATLSVELAEDGQDVNGVLERSLSSALALELDRVALYGDGNPASEPVGILATPGVGIIATGAGQSANYRDVIEAVRQVRSANFEPTTMIYSPDGAAVYDGLVDDIGQPLDPPASFKGLRKLITNQAASGDAFIGDFSELLVGMRTNLVIEASREAATASGNAFSKLQVKIRAYLRADVAVARAGAFCVLQGIAEAGS